MYISLNCDKNILSEFVKDREKSWCCSGYLYNFNFMAIDLYVAVSSLDVSFAHFLISESKRFLLQSFFSFSHIVFIYNTFGLTSQMNLTKKNLIDSDTNTGHLIRSVPDWLVCCMA